MYLVRLFALIVIGFGSFLVAGTGGSFFFLVALLCGILLYFFPMYEAHFRKQPNFDSIFMVNLFLGWTLIGWVVALVWALKEAENVTVINESKQNVFSETVESNDHQEQPAPKATVECPFCAEDILAKARKCKHCGSEVEPAV